MQATRKPPLSDYLSEYLCDIHTLELVIKDGSKNTNRILDVLKTTKKIAKYVQIVVLVQEN